MELRDRLLDAFYDGEVVTNVCIADLLYELDGSIDCYGGNADQWLIHIMWKKLGDESTSLLIWNMLRKGLQTPLNVMWTDNKLKMGNGHHRLIAALLCGITHCDIVVTNYCDHDVTEGSFPHFVQEDGMSCATPKYNSAAKAIQNAFYRDLMCVRKDLEDVDPLAASWKL